MYIKYQVLKAERKSTSTGKDKIDADLQDFNGVVEEKVTIWSDFPNFASIKVGSEVCGQVTVKTNGQYINKTLYPEKTEGWGGGKKAPSVNMNKIMEKKQEGISASQDRKENSIKLAATMRDATLLTLEWIKQENLVMPPTEAEIKAKWTEWRKWLDQSFGDGVPF